MSFRPLCLLALCGVLSAGAAQAELANPVQGTFKGTIRVLDNITYINGELFGTPMSHPVEGPTLEACQQDYQDTMVILGNFANTSSPPTTMVTSTEPCHWVSNGIKVFATQAPQDHKLLADVVNSERVLREKYHLSEYEAEFKRLQQRLYPAR